MYMAEDKDSRRGYTPLEGPSFSGMMGTPLGRPSFSGLMGTPLEGPSFGERNYNTNSGYVRDPEIVQYERDQEISHQTRLDDRNKLPINGKAVRDWGLVANQPYRIQGKGGPSAPFKIDNDNCLVEAVFDRMDGEDAVFRDFKLIKGKVHMPGQPNQPIQGVASMVLKSVDVESSFTPGTFFKSNKMDCEFLVENDDFGEIEPYRKTFSLSYIVGPLQHPDEYSAVLGPRRNIAAAAEEREGGKRRRRSRRRRSKRKSRRRSLTHLNLKNAGGF